MPIKLNGSTSGYSQIQAAAVAGNNTLTLPTSGTNLLADNGSGALTIQTVNSGTSNALTLQSNNATALTIDTSGNLVVATGQIRQQSGSASTPSYSFNTTQGTGIFSPASGVIGFANGTAESMRIDSSGNVGIGTTSPSYKLDVFRGSTNGAVAEFTGNNSGRGLKVSTAQTSFADDTAVLDAQMASYGTLAFNTGGSERMRIDSSGNLLVGQTTATAYQNLNSFMLRSTLGNFYVNHVSGTVSATDYIGFGYNGSSIGSITQNGTTAVAYNTTSDYRLKEDVQPMTGALAKVAALKPCTYKWKADGSDGEGFIAHELQAVIPAAVTGEKDAVDAEGKIKPQGVDYSKIVVHLVSALQEAVAKIDAQAADIAALKAKVGV